MNKKIIGIIITVAIVLIGVVTAVIILGNKDNKKLVDNNKVINNASNVLVVYFSATNNTKRIAEKIASNLNADIFEIVPKNVYTSEDLNWSNSNSRVSREHNDESLRSVELASTNVLN